MSLDFFFQQILIYVRKIFEIMKNKIKLIENEKLAGNALHIPMSELRIFFRRLVLLQKYDQSSVELLAM